ncbi:MAG TPA: enolase C-terminal domain-like protein [Gemmatimonadaceae bacterium]|nr:enolase C-terminal domain-like protein [Gemmatimonadaceae bacterium]
MIVAAPSAQIGAVTAEAYVVPTDGVESDGTLAWSETTLVVVHVSAAEHTGLGYTYADAATARVVRDHLAPVVQGGDAMDVPALWNAMRHRIRNLGRPGIVSMALSAVDSALWDLKARVLGLPLVTLLGAVRDAIPVYGSGGFTSYTVEQLQRQLGGWAAAGIARVKMKVGRDARADRERVRAAREAIGPGVELFVDANGAYTQKLALAQAEAFARSGVTWFEEPVSSDDVDGLRFVRERVPAGMDVAAGEYGYDLFAFRRLLECDAVDVLQVDVTRCGGITELARVDALCQAHARPLSGHTAPSLHVHAACAATAMRHLEYFHDHVRIEQMLLDGAPVPVDGLLAPDRSRPGNGLELRRADAERYRVY